MKIAALAVLILLVILISGCTSTSGPAVQPLYTEIQNADQSSRQSQLPSQPKIYRGFNEFGPCEGTGTVVLAASPLKPEDINYIEPMGAVRSSGGHVTPIDHQYWIPTVSYEDNAPYNVHAPAVGRIVHIQHMEQFIGEAAGPNAPKIDDYRIILDFTCDFYAIYIHVKELSPRIQSITGQISGNKQVNIPVEEDEVIGKVGKSFDFSVHDKNVTLGFIVPKHYEGEPWKIHTADPFDYFTEPLRSQLLAKNLRSVAPLGGKIDYDIDGRLIGTWFKEGTNGYEGINQQRYWEGHLSFLYESIDPSHTVVSTGDFNGRSEAFGIRGNPDPASVSVTTGLVKYELVHYDLYKDGQLWNYYQNGGFVKGLKAANQDEVQGTMLVQMISDRRIKVEIIAGKTASEVSGFTSNAIMYER